MAVNVGQRNVPNTPQYRGLKANELALNLSIHTIKITSNPKVFDDKYQKIIDKIVDCAVNIQMSSWTANNIRVGDDHEKKVMRLKYQTKAIIYCNNLLAYINIAQRLFHLRAKKVAYWISLVLETRNMIGSWNRSDKKRYKDI